MTAITDTLPKVKKSAAVAELKALYMAENRRRFPSLPEGARACYPYTDKNANGLNRCITDYIRFTGGQAERVAVTGRFLDQSKVVTDVTGRMRRIGSGKWIRPSMQPGTADISAVIQGRAVKIEVKIGKDRQSQAQKLYQQQVEAAGGVYIIATSLEQFIDWYQTFNTQGHG